MVEDFFEALQLLTLLRAPLLLNKIEKVDGGRPPQLGCLKSYLKRANTTQELSRLDPNQVRANQYLGRQMTRRSSRSGRSLP